MEYYVCDYHTHQVLRGPWSSAQVVEFINSSDEPKKYCNMSRYLLAKEGVYPNNSAGNSLIEYHLAQSNTASSGLVESDDPPQDYLDYLESEAAN